MQAGCDLASVPRKSLLRLLGEHCGDASDRRALLLLSSRGGRAKYTAEIAREQPSLLDLLKRFAIHCCLCAGRLLASHPTFDSVVTDHAGSFHSTTFVTVMTEYHSSV